MEKKSKEQIVKEMDEAAVIAQKELGKLDRKSVEVVSAWVKKHFMKAGYKRLGRLLVK